MTDLTQFSVQIDEDNIALVTLDVTEESMNVLGRQTMDEISAVLDQVNDNPSIKGVIFTSGKPDSFIAGADVSMLDACENTNEATELSKRGQAIFNRIEQANVPFVSAIHGICLGGGLEFSLACDYRVCSLDEKTKLGLPEVKLGLLPGSGGTQRLPRLVGVQKALDMMLTGKELRAKQALKAGLVDDAVPNSILLTAAKKCLDKGKRRHQKIKRNLMGKALETNSFGRGILFDQALKATLKQTKGNYPAPEKIIEVVRVGLENGKVAGFDLEAQRFGELTQTCESQQLRNIFFATTEMKKDLGIDDESVRAVDVNQVGVLGGGLMGGGIAYVTTSKAGVPVRLKDIKHQGISNALKYSFDLMNKKVKRRFMRKSEMQKQMSMLTGGTDYTGFYNTDLVIEAVFEDLKLKQTMLADVEENCPAHTIFASNTSSLPIAQIAEGSQRPEQVIGLHYFSPVDKMPLVEVIPHQGTSAQTIASTVAFARKQGKTAIVVGDKAGFYVNRILAPYVNESIHLLLAGEPVEAIDKALTQFGFPVGPLKLLDEVGIDIGSKIGPILTEQLGERFTPPEAISAILQDDRKGKKNQKGFYHYNVSKLEQFKGVKPGKLADPSIYSLLNLTPAQTLNSEEVAERCVVLMLNEAVRCFDEGIVRSARDADIGAIFGIGFPPFLGGPLRYIDQMGADKLVEILKGYQARYGDRFELADLLVEYADQDKKFY